MQSGIQNSLSCYDFVAKHFIADINLSWKLMDLFSEFKSSANSSKEMESKKLNFIGVLSYSSVTQPWNFVQAQQTDDSAK
jgi:hypothetical protein